MASILVPAAPRQDDIPVGAEHSSDINLMNDDRWHIATALNLEARIPLEHRPRILHARRNSNVMAPPKALMRFFREARFGQAVMLTDFHF
ncbi:hypothetical protein PIB30_081297 [Stylosanthes scabra]|uniref:Uncharacterized protein n=1 Tax=Stylosanthes scabra TaxID=79078 RepID=A0ABU6ZQD8_9FABA|nr:hypothetical protein [Stylosanthes scabra]